MAAGRPPIYHTPDSFEKKVDEYFENPETRQVIVGTKDNKELVDIPVYTMTGLALHLGFESRQSMYDYAKKEQFSYTVKKAQLRIENMYEGILQTGASPTGAIFALKQMGWRDNQHIDHTTGGKSLTPINVTIEAGKHQRGSTE